MSSNESTTYLLWYFESHPGFYSRTCYPDLVDQDQDMEGLKSFFSLIWFTHRKPMNTPVSETQAVIDFQAGAHKSSLELMRVR